MANLNVNDLAVMVNIIDAGAQGGLFKGGDLKTIGDLRERLVEFVKQVSEQPKEESNESISKQAE
jgi:hypothetical protein